MLQENTNKTADSEDPGAVWSVSALFAQAYLNKNCFIMAMVSFLHFWFPVRGAI